MAEHAHTISGTTLRNPSRRDIAAGGIAMLVLVAAAAGADKAAEIDGELLATCASIHRSFAEDARHSEIMEAADRADHDRLWAEVDQAVWQPLNAAVDRLSELRARTPEGIAAKARVTEFLLMRHHGTEIAEGCEGEEVRLALSLARDLIGRASA